MNPSLAQLVRKWHRTYSNKNQWEFVYDYGNDDASEDLKAGYLKYIKYESTNYPAILIEDNRAVIGEFRRLEWGRNSEWHKTIHSDIELIAADPRFFPKLERAMQFLVRARDRRAENEKKFAAEEMALLKQVLK